MTNQNLQKCIKLKKDIKSLKKTIIQLDELKEKYTDMEYRTKKYYYHLICDDLQEAYDEIKKTLTKLEKIKLVIH